MILVSKRVGYGAGELRGHVLRDGRVRITRRGQRIVMGPAAIRALREWLKDKA